MAYNRCRQIDNYASIHANKIRTFEDILAYFFDIRSGTQVAANCCKSKLKVLIRANHVKAWDAKPLT